MGEMRQAFRVCRHMAALDEELIVEGERHRLARGRGDLRGGIPALDAGDPRRLAAGREGEGIADAHPAAFDAAHDETSVVEFEHILHGEAQGEFRRRPRRLEAVEEFDHRRTLIPGRLRRARRDVVAMPRRDRHHGLRRQAKLLEERGDLDRYGLKARGVEIDEVDLVDDDRDLAQAEELQDQRMAARLLAHTLGSIDDQQGRLRLRDTGNRVLQELLMPRRVDDDVGALRGLEEDLGCVDGDALVTLGLEGIQEERPFEGATALVARGLQFGELAFGEAAGVVQQPADQRGLAVIDMADDGEGKARLLASNIIGGFERDRVHDGSSLHISACAEPLEGVLALMIHGAAGAFRGLGGAEFRDDRVEIGGVGDDRRGDV